MHIHTQTRSRLFTSKTDFAFPSTHCGEYLDVTKLNVVGSVAFVLGLIKLEEHNNATFDAQIWE
jgi:hypothetical protein